MRDGKIATEKSCCCVLCECPIECSPDVSLEILEFPNGVCADNVYTATAPVADQENLHGGITGEMYCIPNAGTPSGIIWYVEISSVFSNFNTGDYCEKVYTGWIEPDASKGCLPQGGYVELFLSQTNNVSGNKCDQVTVPTAAVKYA